MSIELTANSFARKRICEYRYYPNERHRAGVKRRREAGVRMQSEEIVSNCIKSAGGDALMGNTRSHPEHDG